MNIGIFCGSATPDSGGAYTLVDTIKKQLVERGTTHTFIFLYRGNNKEPYKKIIGNDVWVNVNKAASYKYRIKEKVKTVFGQVVYNERLDNVCKQECIDLVWFVVPCEMDVSFPYVYTVWDLGHRILPEFPEMTAGDIWTQRERMYRKMLYRASYVLTGNETGRKEIIDNYAIPYNRIKIAPFPLSDFCYGDEKKPDFKLEDNYFVYPAQFWPHKNHIRIIKAFKILREKYNTAPTIYFTGSDKSNMSYIRELIAKYNLEKQVIITGFLKSEELKYIIKHAKAMIYASLFGPNNLPPMEAAYLGCPVLITDIPGHREEMKDAALYFDGYDEQDLADKIKMILKDEQMASDLMQKGFALAQEFEKIDYCDILNEILEDFAKKRECWKS